MEWLVVAMYVVIALIPSSSDAATQGSVSYLHGDGYASGDDTRNITRFDVLNLNQYGMIYGRADVLSGDDRNSNIVTRIIGHVGNGWHVAGQAQNQKGVSQTNVGAGYGSFGKQQAWFVDLYKINSSYYGDGYSLFGYGSYKFTDKVKADGFIEYILPENGTMQPVLLAQPAIMYNVYGQLWVGVEQQRYFNKSGIRGLDEVVNQFKLKWEF